MRIFIKNVQNFKQWKILFYSERHTFRMEIDALITFLSII